MATKSGKTCLTVETSDVKILRQTKSFDGKLDKYLWSPKTAVICGYHEKETPFDPYHVCIPGQGVHKNCSAVSVGELVEYCSEGAKSLEVPSLEHGVLVVQLGRQGRFSCIEKILAVTPDLAYQELGAKKYGKVPRYGQITRTNVSALSKVVHAFSVNCKAFQTALQESGEMPIICAKGEQIFGIGIRAENLSKSYVQTGFNHLGLQLEWVRYEQILSKRKFDVCAEPVIVIGDSHVAGLQKVSMPDGVKFMPFHGATIAELQVHIDKIYFGMLVMHIVVCIGSNDLTYSVATPEKILAKYEKLFAQLKSLNHVRVVVVPPAFRLDVPHSKVRKINSLLPAACKNHSFEFADILPRLSFGSGPDRDKLNPKDGVHLNTLGARHVVAYLSGVMNVPLMLHSRSG